jgi:hypothetical protein
MHMKANLLAGIGDVGVGKYQVLEGHDEAPELCQINNRRLRSGEDRRMCVHGC